MVEIARIGHIHIKVSNLKRAEKFYTDLLGLKVTERVANYVFLSFGKEHHDVALQEILNAETPSWNSIGLYHFAVEVKNLKELARIYVRLKNAGIAMSPVNHCISKALYFSDPDGNGIEVYVDTRSVRNRWSGITKPLDIKELLSHFKK